MQEKKSAAAKKKAALLKKMKSKRQNTMNQFSMQADAESAIKQDAAMEDQIKTGIKELEMPQTKDAVMMDSKKEDEVQENHAYCANCQEPIEMDKYYERPFV